MNRDAMIEALAKAIYCAEGSGRLPAPWTCAGDVHEKEWAFLRKEYEKSAAAALELMMPKPLVWDVFEGGRGAKATAWRKANYLITHWSDGRFELVESYPGYQGDNIAGAFMPTLEAAQAAAQDHADAAHWANTPLGKLVGAV